MISIRTIIKNLSTGQSSIKIRAIIRELEEFYQSIIPDIKLLHAKKELDGTTLYFKIPSQNEKKLFYDIVIWFNSQDEINLETEIKVYSNSPYFAFNFVYLFNRENSLLFPTNYANVFRTKAPKIRNPLDTVSFDKHVYSALRSVSRRNLKNILVELKNSAAPMVKSFEEKQEEIQKLREDRKKRSSK